MSERDRYDLPLTAGSAEAAAAYRNGMELYFAGWTGVGPAIEEAIALDPDFALARAAKATFRSMAHDPETARTEIGRALEIVERRGTPRERSHVRVLHRIMTGPRPEAITAALGHVEECPRDAFILSLLLGAFGMLAFSGMPDHEPVKVRLCNRYASQYGDDWWFATFQGWAEAENGNPALGRRMLERALGQRRENAHAAHAFTHALFEAGDHEEAETFLESWLPLYSPGGPLHGHIAWHKAWLAVDRGDTETALDNYARYLAPSKSAGRPPSLLADAASFLWRLRVYGYEIPQELWQDVLAYGRKYFPKGGFPFVDMHMAYVAGATGDLEDFGQRASDHHRLLEAGALPGGAAVPVLCKGMLSMAQGDYAGAAELLESALPHVVRLGGSGAQRSIVEDMLLIALTRSGNAERAVNQFGSDRVVGLDLSYASLRKCRSVVPDILYLRGNAWHLPFADNTLEAVNCSNSLQLIPNTPQVLKEVGRTLKPGGTFTCFTYRKSPPGRYRTFQHTLERILSIQAFALDDVKAWLKAANMELVDVSGPNLVLLFTAQKMC